MKEESLLLLSDLQKLINQVVLIDYTIIILGGVSMMYAIDPTMSFAQVVQYYKDYVKRTKSYGRKPVSFLRFVTGRY